MVELAMMNSMQRCVDFTTKCYNKSMSFPILESLVLFAIRMVDQSAIKLENSEVLTNLMIQ